MTANKRIDSLSKPCTFYYEDVKGNNIPYELTDVVPHEKWYAQHFKNVEVHHSICFGADGSSKKDKWPIRFLNWVIYKMPASWKKPVKSLNFSSTINCSYPIIKYLVDNKQWSFNEACVASKELCERCLNLALDEVGSFQNMGSQYYMNIKHPTSCEYCKIMDPIHFNKRRMFCCLQTFKVGGDVGKAYRELSINSEKRRTRKP